MTVEERQKRLEAVDRALWAVVCPGYDYADPRQDWADTLHETVRRARKDAIAWLEGFAP